MPKKNILFTIILLAVFTGTSILALLTAKKVTDIKYSSSTNSPDFFMTNATYTKFNLEGKIQNRIDTDKITHFTTDNIYLFDKPDMLFYTPGEQPWHVTANKGRSKQGKSKVYLWDTVKIVRAASSNNPNFDIATTALTIYPNVRFAETDQPVTIIQNDTLTKAVGAEADFKTGIVKLISKIDSWLQIK